MTYVKGTLTCQDIKKAKEYVQQLSPPNTIIIDGKEYIDLNQFICEECNDCVKQ